MAPIKIFNRIIMIYSRIWNDYFLILIVSRNSSGVLLPQKELLRLSTTKVYTFQR